MSVTRIELFHIWCERSTITDKNSLLLFYAINKFELSDKENMNNQGAIKKLQNLNSKFTTKWKKCNRTLAIFLERHQQWLDGTEVLLATETPEKRKRVRPSKDFSEVTNQSKKQKISYLLKNYTAEELSFAASTSFRKSGKRDAAVMVQTVTANSPRRASKIKKIFHSSSSKNIVSYTPEEALALYIDGRFTKHSYNIMRAGAKERNCDIYPSYDIIKKAKEECYPVKASITLTEAMGEVKLQGLVDHTATRLVMLQEEVMKEVSPQVSRNITLTYKWGCDGSAGHSNYKQKFDSKDTDSYIFAVCLVPLRLEAENNTILWNNPRPSSTRFCRPIKVLFEKESTDLCKKVVENVRNQIKEILPTEVLLGITKITVNHRFQLTMIDGKIFGILTDSFTQTCGICGSTPKIMNDLDQIMKRTPNIKQYHFGLSTLHAWIRCFETLLQISYRLDIKKWQIRDANDKIRMKEKKDIIQKDIRDKMGLLVDIPKPGFGTTNDGNTARKFFSNPILASSITGLDENLIHRFSIILRTLSCGYAINTDAFDEYAKDTAAKFVSLYSWYYMPSSIHKLLIHGADIIKEAVLPIGMLSEEALESKNKDLKKFREHHKRKMSRQKTMEDLFHALLFSSDPLISGFSKTTSLNWKKESVLHADVLQLLSDPNLPTMDSKNDEDSSQDSDDYQDSDSE